MEMILLWKIISGFASAVCIIAGYKYFNTGDIEKAMIFFSLSIFWGNEVFKIKT